MNFLERIGRDTHGATAIEYGILIAALAIPTLFSLNFFGQTLSEALNTVSTAIVGR